MKHLKSLTWGDAFVALVIGLGLYPLGWRGLLVLPVILVAMLIHGFVIALVLKYVRKN